MKDTVSFDIQSLLKVEMVINVKVTTPATSGGQSNTTSGAVTSVPGAGGCPAFEFSTCDPNCVVMDDKGCLSCSCAGRSIL